MCALQVRYMISSIQYGGRITDDFDQLLMDTFSEKYFHLGALVPNYELYKDERSGFSYKWVAAHYDGSHITVSCTRTSARASRNE